MNLLIQYELSSNFLCEGDRDIDIQPNSTACDMPAPLLASPYEH